MNKKNALFLIMAAGTLVGCGNGDAENSVLELFSSKAENVAILESIAAEFNAQNPEHTVNVVAPADAATVLKTRMAKNDMPDIIAIGGDSNFTEVQGAGMLVDLSNEVYVSDLHKSYLEMVYNRNENKEEKVYGIPYATNASGIIYNKDLFEQVGVSVPHTWDEFVAVIEKLDSAGINPFVFTYKDSWTILPPWNSMAPVIQPDNFMSDRMEGKATFLGTHEEVLEKMIVLMNYAQPDFMGTSYNDGNKAFATGAGAMMINGNWAINQITASNPDINLGMFSFPTSNTAAKNKLTSGVDVLLAVVDGDEEKESIAKKFVEYAVSPEVASRYIEDQFAFSAIKGVEQTNPAVADISKEVENGNVENFPDHYYPNGLDLQAVLSGFAMNYVSGMDDDENINKTLKDLDAKYDAVNIK
ncbi:ABC transporter substrate-binding protein [Candidatus Epulonipiscium viviparus]|uniref:ABC transporter substrate-binding protein n=1 Tax=Candidatus Epulonipiscium viviparus TaxID=420336 RepID=UPI0027380987|nr:extracellular solute-binding protein [Candidatus Epulopiscium viviparus]